MDSQVSIQLLDRAVPLLYGSDERCLEDVLLDICRNHLNISPVSFHLFSFKQGLGWLAPGTTLREIAANKNSVLNPPVLRIRFKIPGWRSSGGTKSLRHIDPVAFRYFYDQVRTDFDKGKVCSRKHSERSEKWWAGLIQTGGRDRKEEVETLGNVMDLVARNMAIDITEGIRDKKEVASNVKCYIPRDLWSGLEKIMAVKLLQAKVETCVDKLLKGYKNTTGPFPLKEDFLRQTEKYFPSYFHEEFSAHWDEGGRISEIKLVITHPKEDEETQLVVLRRIDREEVAETVATISQICNIALQDAGNIEISRMNGIPLYFRILNQQDTISILSLLCGYYRLVEKWSFSLCSELKYPILEDLITNKVHGPITKEFAISKLQKLNFKKGSFLLRQSPDKHGKIFLLFCYETGCRPEELCILRDKDTGLYTLDRGGRFHLPEEVYQPFSSVSLVVQAIRTGQTSFQMLDCIHLSEYDKCPSLLLCRNPVQWKHDSLGSKPSTTSDRYFIPYNNLSKFEGVCHQGLMCKVWKGEWRHNTADRRVVAIKQLRKDLMGEKMMEFLNLATRVMRWDDPSLVTVYGACLPMENEPLVIVREYFEYGPLDAYLRENKSKIQNVDMLEAGTSLARALYYLQGKGLVHGEIRCRNVYVMEHTDKLLKVKLCEGGLGAPRIEDVHWLDWIQLQGLLNSGALLNSGFKSTPGSIGSPGGGSCTVGGNTNRLKCSLASDIWSYGTLLWEIFSKGEPPLPNTPPVEACKQYVSGVRLKWPLGSQLKQVETIMMNCWSPLPEQRIKPQTIMRDMNQILYRVFNSRRANDYVTIDSGVTISTTAISSPGTPPTPPLTSTLPFSADRDQGTLVPVFTEHTRNLFESSINQLLNFTGFGETDSTSPLINDSESSSSLYNSDISALTYQTSLDYGGNYSITSIYPLEDDQIEYNTDFPLGEGNFGIVYKGVLTKSDGDWEQVAVKMIKDTDIMPQSAFDDMEREIGLMKRLSHENIVKIRGYISNIGTHTIIVMEYIREGSLDRYLQVNRRTLDYPRQLFVYAQNIVDGMEYLTQNKIIHRDLAARNILVSDHESVKISDFGLARDVSSDYYVMQSTTNIPVKWLAVECLLHSKYSHASDVWSFGVTLWEMFTFGQTPALIGCESFFQHGESYQRHRQDLKEWVEKLEGGVRLPQTDFCPNYLYSRVMLPCWDGDATSRPTFTQLRHMLKQVELEAT